MTSNVDGDQLRVPTKEDRDPMDRVWLGIAGNSTTNVSPKDRMEIWVAEHRIPPNPEGKLAPYGYIKYLPGWFAPSPDGPIPDNPAAPTAVQQNPWSAR